MKRTGAGLDGSLPQAISVNRDRAFDAGARSVHVAGLPLRLAAAGFPSGAELPRIAD